MYKHVKNSLMMEASLSNLERKVETLSADLTASRAQKEEDRSAMESLRTQLAVTQNANAKLKKEMSGMNSKLYSEVERRVEERMKYEKSTLETRLREAVAKAQRYDMAASTLSETQKQLKDAVRDRDKHVAAYADLETKCEQLQEQNMVTQQGYDQVRLARDESDMKAVTLEADLSNLRAQMRELRDPKAHQNSEYKPNGIHQTPVPTNISILAHKDRLTELDRLEMIAQRWQSDLNLAESDNKKHKDALKDTEDQIVDVLSQLEKLETSKGYRKGRSRSKADSVTTKNKDVASSGVRLNARLDTFAANIAPATVLSLTHWSRAVEQNKAQGSTAQPVSTIQTKRMSFFESLRKK